MGIVHFVTYNTYRGPNSNTLIDDVIEGAERSDAGRKRCYSAESWRTR